MSSFSAIKKNNTFTAFQTTNTTHRLDNTYNLFKGEISAVDVRTATSRANSQFGLALRAHEMAVATAVGQCYKTKSSTLPARSLGANPTITSYK
jgi:hypothetical protein